MTRPMMVQLLTRHGCYCVVSEIGQYMNSYEIILTRFKKKNCENQVLVKISPTNIEVSLNQ